MPCLNRQALDSSNSDHPAMPLAGTSGDVLHICPNDGTRWWQFNTFYHLWQKVESDAAWGGLLQDTSGVTLETLAFS